MKCEKCNCKTTERRYEFDEDELICAKCLLKEYAEMLNSTLKLNMEEVDRNGERNHSHDEYIVSIYYKAESKLEKTLKPITLKTLRESREFVDGNGVHKNSFTYHIAGFEKMEITIERYFFSFTYDDAEFILTKSLEILEEAIFLLMLRTVNKDWIEFSNEERTVIKTEVRKILEKDKS